METRIKASWLVNPPSLHELTTEILATVDLDIPTERARISLVERIRGDLLVSGFVEPLSERAIHLAEDIVRNKIGVYRKHLAKAYAQDFIDKNMKTAATEDTRAVVSDDTSDKFLEIEALMKKGKCPRCKTSMTPVKLRKYEPANYCNGCRTTLWQQN